MALRVSCTGSAFPTWSPPNYHFFHVSKHLTHRDHSSSPSPLYFPSLHLTSLSTVIDSIFCLSPPLAHEPLEDSEMLWTVDRFVLGHAKPPVGLLNSYLVIWVQSGWGWEAQPLKAWVWRLNPTFPSHWLWLLKPLDLAFWGSVLPICKMDAKMRIALSLQGVLGGFDGVMETMASMLKRSVSTNHHCYEVGSTHTGGQRGVDGTFSAWHPEETTFSMQAWGEAASRIYDNQELRDTGLSDGPIFVLIFIGI